MKVAGFAGGLSLGLLLGLVVPVWAQGEASRVAALEARLSALERRLSDPSERNLELSASDQLRLTVGQSSMTMKKDGSIDLRGVDIHVLAKTVEVKETGSVAVRGSKIGGN